MVRKIAKEILNALESPDGELSLSFVTDREIAMLNEKHRSSPRPTDVLAFSMREGDFMEINPSLLGDVVISAERAKKQADERGELFEEELCRLLIHGILHLMGYDHEPPGPRARAMRKKEKELFSLIATHII